MRYLLRVGLLLALAAPAQARTLARVALPDTLRLEGTTLVLNGAAVYRKLGFRVLVAGLYLSHPESDADAVLAADEPRRYVSRFVRGVRGKKIRDAWRKGFVRNNPNAADGLKARFETLCDWIGDQESGDEIVFTYRPGVGSTVESDGAIRGPVPGKDFADAYFALALGRKPVSGGSFKAGLLGR